MPPRLPVLLATAATPRLTWAITNVRLGGAASEPLTVGISDGAIEFVDGRRADEVRDRVVVDAGGRCMVPGLIDVHAHLNPRSPQAENGVEPIRPVVRDHLLADELRDALSMGVTTVRDVGSYGDAVFEARQAMRYGAFRGPRVLTCGRIVSATAPGGRFFDGMYAEADGADGVRAAAREQIRRGADFVKIMATGARSVELEDPDPAQVTEDEMQALVSEVHRLGYRVAAHCEGVSGTELAVRAGVDTIEHGMYLNQRPDLLELMAEQGQFLVPTFGCFYGVAGLADAIGTGDRSRAGSGLGEYQQWTPLLRDLANYNLEQADLTLNAALAAGVDIAAGHDWHPFSGVALEIARLAHHGMTTTQAIRAGTAGGAAATGLDQHLGAVAPGLFADLVVVDGDPYADVSTLCNRDNVWLVVQQGTAVAGAALLGDVARRLDAVAGGDPAGVDPGSRRS